MSKRTTRREKEHQRHIKHILDVAESIFAQEGFRATMRQIAQKAEFALGTIYAYFGSKKQLYERVIESKVNDLSAVVVSEMAKEHSVQAKIEKFVHTKMNFLRENLAFLRLYMAGMGTSGTNAEHVLPRKAREKYDSMLHDLAGVFQNGIRKRFLKPMDVALLARSLDNLTNALALSWQDAKTRLSIETDMHTLTELFLHGVIIHREKGKGPDNEKELNNRKEIDNET